ncbi:MAG: PH domain-containing protein [Thermodesulfobacteriota bacterium]
MRSTFESSRDGFVATVTVASVVLLGAFGGLLLIVGLTRPAPLGVRIVSSGSGIMCLGILVGTWLFCPRRFCLTAHEIVVERPAGDVAIALASVRGVELLDPRFSVTWRTFGSGGLFGVFGTFFSGTLGTLQVYGRRSRGGVLLRTDGDNVVLRPDDPEAFVREVSAALGRGAGRAPANPRA